MPDFDKNLQPVIKDASLPIKDVQVKAPKRFQPVTFDGPPNLSKGQTVFDLLNDATKNSYFGDKGIYITNATLDANRRYAKFNPLIDDYEDYAAYGQSNWDKAANGVLKGLNIAATTVAGLGGLLYGGTKSLFTGKFSDVYNNEITRGLDEWNTTVDNELLPNYYTKKEREAEWYSPDNWFKTNFLFDKLMKNSGYAVGAMVTGNIVGAGIRAGGAAIGTGLMSASEAAAASQTFKIFTPLLRNSARAFSVAKNAEAAAILEKEITSIADVAKQSEELAKIAKTTNQFRKFNDISQRSITAIFSSSGEASMEALQTGNEFKRNLVGKWKEEHNGEDPTGADLEKINEMTAKVGKMSFFGNMGLLGITEYVQLPKLLGSNYASNKQVANSLFGKVDDVILENGKYVAAKAPMGAFGKVIGVGKYFFDPKEAVQEGLQYGLQVGTENYYNKMYQSKDANFWVDNVLYGLVGRDASGKGVGALVSKEGAESMLLGGLTGGPMQAMGNLREAREIKSNTSDFLNQLNNAPTFKEAFKERLASANRGIVLQQQEQEATMKGDQLEAEDLQTDQLHNYLAPRIKYGRFDMIMEDLAEFKQQGSTEQGLAELKKQGFANVNDTVQSYLQRISNIETVAKNTEQIQKSMYLRYSGVVIKDADGKPVLNAQGQQMRAYSDRVIDKMVYAASKVSDYDNRIPQVSTLVVSSKLIDVQNIVNEELTNENSTALKDELEKIDGLDRIDKDDIKESLIQTVELSARRKLFLKEYEELKNNPEKFDTEIEEIIDEESAKKELVTIKTKSGDTKIETNTEYYLGKVVEYSKDGKPVYRMPTITILADNGDGTIKIKDNSGNIRDINKSVLEDYKLGKVESLQKDKKGKFFHDNWNTVFKHKGLKDSKGNPYQGRLEYSPKDRVLLFKYVNERGQERSVEVTGEHFVAQKGYTNPMVEAVTKLTASQEASMQEYSKEKDDVRQSLQKRKQITAELVKDSKDRLDEVNKELEKSKNHLSQIEEALHNAMFTKKGLPRKSLKAYKKTIDQLTKEKESVQKIIDSLEDERESLEGQLPYLESLLDYVSALPDEYSDAIDDLKEDINNLNEMIDNTKDSIKTGNGLISKIDELLTNALSIFKDFVVRLKEENPTIPLLIEDFQKNIEKFLGEEGAKDFIEKRLGYTNAVMDLQEQVEMFNEEMEIPDLTKRLQKLEEQLKELNEGLNDLTQQAAAKQKLLEKFEDAVKEYEEEMKQQELLQKSQEFVNEIIKTHDLSQRTLEEEEGFEEDSKKTNLNVVKSGIPSQNIPGYENANQFGNNFEDFENKDQLRAVLVTSKNEADYGLEGLTKHLAQGKDELPKDDPNYVDPDQTIVMVMVEEGKDGVIRLVGVDGKVLEDTATFDNTVYQVMPSEELRWSEEYGGKSMFRKDTPTEVVESLKKQYKEWRDGIIANPPTTPFGIDASFGVPEKVTIKNEEGKDVPDPSARVSVEESGLVSEGELGNRSVIVVPTTGNIIERGTTKFKNALGMVFLKMRNGFVKLQNRKLTEKEATVVYQVIERVATKIFEDGDAQGEETQRLLNWLKTVVYWGTPKDSKGQRKKAGRNSIWFENVNVEGSPFSQLRLFISNNDNSIPFTPQYLRDNKTQMISLLQELYNNVNSTRAVGSKKMSWNEPYEEVIEVKSDGTIVSRDWPNYQTFLLSNKMPDSDGNLTLDRPNEEIPLITQIKPKTSPSEVNRKSVYFILKDVKYTEPKLAPAPKAVTKIVPGKGAAGVSTSDSLEKRKSDLESQIYEAEIVKVGDKFQLEDNQGAIITEADTREELEPILAEYNERDALIRKQLAELESKPTTKEAPEGTMVLDGKTINTFVSPSGKQIKWGYDPNKSGADAIIILKGGDILEVIDSVKKQIKEKNPSVTEEELSKLTQNRIKQIVHQSIPAGALEEFDEEVGIIIPDDEDDSSIVINEESPVADEVDEIVIPSEEGEDESVVIPDDISDIEDDMRDLDVPHDLRVVVEDDIDQYEGENWNKVAEWLKANFPNLPVYRVKNILKATNGLQAWGMLKKGALYVYENAEVGTIYHEVFEAVWKHFSSPREQRAIIKEFKSRKGTFVDRPTGREIAYKDATNSEIKEQLAEEFRDYVHQGKIPAKPVGKKPLILRLFADIVNAIKNFFANTPTATNNTERLFQKIGSGYYKEHAPYAAKLSFAEKGIMDIEDAIIDADSELRLKLRGETIHDIMQQMTYMTLRDLMGNNESLFSLEKVSKKDLYRKLKYNIGRTVLLRAKAYKEAELLSKEERKLPQEQKNKLIRERKNEMRKNGDLTYSSKIGHGVSLWKNVMRQWDNIISKHEEYLKAYSVEFDENDDIYMKSDENSGKGEYDSADKIDHFRKTNSAIKLLLSTLPMMSDGKIQYSSINGVKLLSLSKVYMSLMNNLHTARSLDEMIERVRQMAINDENYRLLYSRLTGTDYNTNTFNLESIEEFHDLQLLSAFWKTFKKQSPDVRSIFIFENGDVNISDSNFSSAGRQIQREYENSMKVKFRGKNRYFEYDPVKKSYVGKADSISKIALDSTEAKVKFLKEIGIDFTEDEVNKLSADKKKTFDDAVSGIRKSISESEILGTISGNVLNIEGRLLSLGLIRAQLENPEFDSTFFNVNGERTQSFIGTNAISDLFDAIHDIDNLNDLVGTQYEYILTDEFAQNSVIINRMFDLKTGKRREDILNYMKGAYADGTVDLDNGKRKQSSKLTYKQRVAQEINMNLNGYYYNLVPGDASMEHMVFMGNAVTPSSLMSGFKRTFDIFKGYFISEVMLSRSNRQIVDTKGRNTKDLRFFKGILGEELHDKIINDKKNLSPEDLYKAYEKQINDAVEKYIKKEAENTKKILFEYNILEFGPEENIVANGLDLESKDNLTEASLNRQMNALAINYMISNIELHKLLYSDPYQYSDELKRIKQFLSPRQTILNSSPTMNAAMNKVFNRGYSKDDVAYTDMDRDFFRTVVFDDVLAEHNLPGYEEAMYKETDGAGIIIDKANRNMRFRSGEWNTEEEKQFRYDMAWYKNHKGLPMSKEEEKILEKGNPSIRSAYTTKKPIVSGNKADGKSYNDVALDKFALYPLSYRVMYESAPRNEKGEVIETNAMRLYDKMMAEDIDYAVFETGRKVGTTKKYSVYNEDGSFNQAPYDTINNIPFNIFSIQSEVPSKEDGSVTRGTQPTKLMTLDFMAAGVPIDFDVEEKNFDKRYAKWISLKTEEEREAKSELYKEIKNNQMLLEAMIENGYNSLLKRMGIIETVKNGKKSFEIQDRSKTAQTLRNEILKRETNDNISEAIAGFLNGDAVLEATPAYQQIRNILYSIADREVVSQEITGGQKIQIPSVFMETNRIAPKIINGKKVYSSDVLKFYEKDGKQVCEIMISRWFDSPLSDEELLDYLNNTPEGQKILSGLAFRIPSQKQNSIESFVVKRFLPKEFGDNVVIPAPLVQKAGSDFDIDKLFIYLKNTFVGKDGKPKLIEFLTDKNSTPEERYVHWVRDNANRDTKGYIKFLTRQAIQNLKTNFNIEFAKIQAAYQYKRAEGIEDLYKEMVSDIKSNVQSKTTDQENYLDQLFTVGHKVFFAMDDVTRDPFWELKSEISRRGIKGPDEIRRYLALASSIIEDPNTIEEDIPHLQNLVKIYSEELRVMGIKQEIIDDIRKEAIEGFRKDKDVLKYALKLDVKKGFDTISDLYQEAKDKENFTAAQEIADIDELPSFDEFKQRSIYDQNTKKALQNGYIQSSQNLVSHPMNFDQLIKPNSADQAKELAKEITKKRGFEPFDYTSTNNMLSRGFMSKLRHAFVSGKYAIGIAAVNQTNHSLNQRQPIYINSDMLEFLSEEDKMWLGDAKINFNEKEYNSMKINGKQVPVLSMIMNKAGEYISDLIGQFIDGYVDISKGPWIMELGATPNVASTWLFLMKLGVPLKTVGYFMNQPIVRDYLSIIENSGYSWLFIDTIYDGVKDSYGNRESDNKTIPSQKLLGDMIGKKKSELTAQQREQQVLILKEFLKYARMANHMFLVTQGSNFDTATFNDPYLVFKKMEQYKLAQNTIISSVGTMGVDGLINNSFLRKISSTIADVRNAYAEILQSDRNNIRDVIEPILRPYVNLSDRDFVKIAQKAVADLFDWAVQTDEGFNKAITDILLSDKNAAEEVSDFIKSVKANPKHPLYNNYVINSLVHSVENDVNNLSLKNRDNKVYDQNQVIYGFSEMKEYLEGRNNKKLYERLVLQSFLQSGLSTSKISFTSLLPYEDFRKIYNKTLSKLNNLSNLQQFRELGVFERNNWNNEDIVPKSKAAWIKVPDFQFGERWQYNPSMAFLPNAVQDAISNGEIPQAVSISSGMAESNGDYMVYSWEKTEEELLTEKEMKLPSRKRRELVKEKKIAMRKKGDYSYMKKGLFKRVYDGTLPYTHTYKTSKGEIREYHIYSMINAWGDSYRANEFYDVARPSVIDNNFLKVGKEVEDSKVVGYFEADKMAKEMRKSGPRTGSTVTRTISAAPVSGPSSTTKINIYASTGENAELSNFAIRPFNHLNINFKSVEQAFQFYKSEFSPKNDNNRAVASVIKDTTDGKRLRELGREFKGLDQETWDKMNSTIMKTLLKDSFQQNPEALAKLLATGNATLTHTQDTSKWGKEFPRLLMEVRNELRGEQSVTGGPKTIKPEGLPEIKQQNKNSCR